MAPRDDRVQHDSRISRDYGRIVGQTIYSGTSLGSGFFDLGEYPMLAIMTPSGMGGSLLSFKAATTPAGPFNDLYDDVGGEVLVSYAANRMVAVSIAGGALAPLRYLQVRSGPTASANNQTANMTLDILTKG